MTEQKLLNSSERAAFSLRSLYKQYGYLPFKMSKFEEYDLYVRNKDFLISDNVITFNDTDGRLLALKPDVTLSIIKNSSSEPGCKQKVYYNENVYRVSQKLHRFKEIMQVGLECIGDTDILDTYEVALLAAESLALITEDFVLDLSHLGILSKVLESASDSADFAKEATVFIAEKNRHELIKLCERYSVDKKYFEIIPELAGMYGDMPTVLARLKPICDCVGADGQYTELKTLCDLLGTSPNADRIKIDFSVVNNMNYYNGIVFKGFVAGLSEGPLAGGEYGTLMKKMGKPSGAVGFAIYLDMLDELPSVSRGYDVDVLIVYGEKCDTGSVIELKNKLISEGLSVSVQKAIPSKLRYKEIIKLEK
ncbi:MAG: hypothetical protein E7612_06640 [Ruminococcaceae bacterium]|nr:hypothetical protein [Oscillospiraceae bacterium]